MKEYENFEKKVIDVEQINSNNFLKNENFYLKILSSVSS